MSDKETKLLNTEDSKPWAFLEQHKTDLIFDSGLRCWLVVAMGSGGVVEKVISRASAGTSPRSAVLDAMG